MTKDLEARLLASVPTIGHFQRLEEMGVNETSFQFYSPLYRYIGEIIREHNHLPRLLDLKATFNLPDHIQRKPEEFAWLLDEFLKLTIVQRVQDIVETVAETYGEDPKELVPALIKELTKLQIADPRIASLTDESALKRLEQYEEKMSMSGGFMIGCPTGLSYFDNDYRIGWLPGELVGIVGRLYTGKSWILMNFGVIAWIAGKRIVLLSPEMTKEEAEARFDVLVCGMKGIYVDINDFYRGFKPNEEQKKVLKDISASTNWITLTSDEGHAFRLNQIPRIIRQYNPDILLVDGLELIASDSRGKQAWEQIHELSYGLKNIAQGTGISILVAHQANRQAHDINKAPNLHEIASGDAFGRACDRVITISRAREDKLRLNVQKFRKGKKSEKGFYFDFLPGQGKVREDHEYRGTTDNLGDLGEDLQNGTGDIDLMPLSP